MNKNIKKTFIKSSNITGIKFLDEENVITSFGDGCLSIINLETRATKDLFKTSCKIDNLYYNQELNTIDITFNDNLFKFDSISGEIKAKLKLKGQLLENAILNSDNDKIVIVDASRLRIREVSVKDNKMCDLVKQGLYSAVSINNDRVVGVD